MKVNVGNNDLRKAIDHRRVRDYGACVIKIDIEGRKN